MSGPPSNRRPASNVGSILLTPQENEGFFKHLGKKCTSLCSAVVQVYGADRNSSWVKKCCGVACLVKDSSQRSYFIRVFDMKDGRQLFDQELYNNFSVNCSRPYFITFAGDTCQIGLNFASEEEARRFKSAVNELLFRRGRKTEKRRDPPNEMMFCTTFLSVPTDEILDGASDLGGCLAPLQCLVLPQDELYGPFSDAAANLRHSERTCVVMGKILLNVGLGGGDVSGRCSPSFLLSPAYSVECEDAETSLIYEMSLTVTVSGPSGPSGPTLPMATVDIKNPEINQRYQNNTQMNNFNLHSNFNRKDKDKGKGKNKKKKISKSEIGTPSNFRHVGHVGWDPNTGFDLNNLDPELKNLFDMCGISEAQLKDKETSKDIYEFIEMRGGVEAVKNELRRQDTTDSAPPTPAPSSGIVGALMEVMQKRSKAIHSSDEDDDDDDVEDFEDEDEWDE
ncbi:hypothetical protein cypCar_00004704 [Cyprinus carpio]|nr:hypothetical protein cypCar_00004704 [Cyprinus carpio]